MTLGQPVQSKPELGSRRGCRQCIYLEPIAYVALRLRHASRREPALSTSTARFTLSLSAVLRQPFFRSLSTRLIVQNFFQGCYKARLYLSASGPRST